MILNSIKKHLPEAKKIFTSGALSDLLASVRRIATTTKERLGSYEALINTLANTPDIISDYQAEKGIVNIDDVEKCFVNVTKDTSDVIESTLTYVRDSALTPDSPEGTLQYATDSAGRVFCFQKFDSQTMSHESGFTPIVTYVNEINNAVIARSQCLLFKEGDKYYLNTLLIPYANLGSAFEKLDTVTSGHFINYLVRKLGWDSQLPDSTPFTWILAGYLAHIDPDYDGNLPGLSAEVEKLFGVYYDLSTAHFGSDPLVKYPEYVEIGKLLFGRQVKCGCTSLFSFTSDLIAADAINQAITSISEAITSGNSRVTDIYSIISTSLVEKFASVRQFCAGLQTAWTRGGFKGALVYIISWYASPKDFEVDENGLIGFTDNSSFMPKEYIAGLMLSIGATVLSLVGTIAMFFSRVVGAVVMALGGILSAIAKCVTADKDNTYASINFDDYVIEQCAPFAIYQFSLAKVKDFAKICEDQAIPGAVVHVPGGVLIASSNGMSGREKTMWEFHPSIQNHTRMLMADDSDDHSIFSSLFTLRDDFSTYLTSDGENLKLVSGRPTCILNGYRCAIGLSNGGRFDPEMIYALWNKNLDSYDPDTAIGNDEKTQHVTPSNDAQLRRNVIANIAIFSLFLLSFSYVNGQYYALNTHGDDDVDSILSDLTLVDGFFGKNKKIAVDNQGSTNLSTHTGNALGIYQAHENEYSRNKWQFSQVEWENWLDTRALALVARVIAAVNNSDSALPSWANIISGCNDINDSIPKDTLNLTLSWYTFDQMHYSGLSEPQSFLLAATLENYVRNNNEYLSVYSNSYDLTNYKNEWALIVPQYNASTFMAAIIATVAIAAVVTTVTAIAVVKFNKWRRNLAIKQTADVDSAWNSFSQSGSVEDRNAYYKAVRKNNMCRWLTGNSKYSRTNYWAGDVSASGDAEGDSDQSLYDQIMTAYQDSSAIYNEGVIDGTPQSRSEDSKRLLEISKDVLTPQYLLSI